MGAIIPAGQVVWGLQLPIQSQSTRYVQPWEAAAGPDELALVAQAADDAGAFYVAVCDHVAVPRPADEAMSSTWYDTVATLGWLAGITERVRLLSHVYVPAYRHPLATAKAFSTLDVVSGGRIVMGVGAGHVKGEFELLGLPFEQRGALLDEAIDALRAAFAEDYRASGRFHECLDRLKDRLSDPIADRLIESLRIAREVGGSDLGTVLRTLSRFLREDARTRAELETRQGWTVNAARLAAAAPWIVLGMLSFQPKALTAYSTPQGVVILAVGAAVTVVAYRLMVRIGRLPDDQRVLR